MAVNIPTCQHLRCEMPGIRRLSIPVSRSGAPALVMAYCNEHAEAILTDPMSFPGAREVVVVE